MPAKILYLQSYSTDFRESLLQLEDVEGGHLGGKFQVRSYFTFAMARWKLCASTTFEILHFQTVQSASKNPISLKLFNRFSKSLPSTRRCWGWAFGWKVSDAQVFYFCNGKVKTLRIDNIWNFATFNLYTVPAKILYLQKYSTDFFRNRLPQLEDVEGGHLGVKFQMRRYFTFAMAR